MSTHTEAVSTVYSSCSKSDALHLRDWNKVSLCLSVRNGMMCSSAPA